MKCLGWPAVAIRHDQLRDAHKATVVQMTVCLVIHEYLQCTSPSLVWHRLLGVSSSEQLAGQGSFDILIVTAAFTHALYRSVLKLTMLGTIYLAARVTSHPTAI